METKIEELVKSVRTKHERNLLKCVEGDLVYVRNNDTVYLYNDGDWIPRVYFSLYQVAKMIKVKSILVDWTVKNFNEQLQCDKKTDKLKVHQILLLKALLNENISSEIST